MKNILITGASSGLGRTIAEVLHSKGHNVVGTSRNPNQHKAKYPLYQLDINEDQDVFKVVERFIKEHGKIDVLVNNAGYCLSGPVEETSITEAKTQFETNFFGLVRVTKEILPLMRDQKGGLIINIGSVGGLISLPFHSFYCASKYAVEGFTESLRMEVKPYGINVLNIDPGDFKSSFTKNRRISAGLTSVYKENLTSALEVCKKEELDGLDPQIIADLVEKLIRKQNSYRVRYIIAPTILKIVLTMKKILGSRLFESMIMKNYNQNELGYAKKNYKTSVN